MRVEVRVKVKVRLRVGIRFRVRVRDKVRVRVRNSAHPFVLCGVMLRPTVLIVQFRT
jgi:hypothetical protein